MSIKNFRERSPILIGILSIVTITAATTFAFYIDKLGFVKQAYEIKAEFADAAGLKVENQVRVAGIKVGTIEDIDLARDRVVVTMSIDNATEVPDEATAEIKLATILGTKFVDIDAAGEAPFLEEGDTIPLDRTKVPYEIYQASNQGTDVLEEIDGAALNDMLAELAKLTRVAKDEVAVALEGLNDLGKGLNARSDELESLLAGADDLTALLADEGDEIVSLIDSSNEVLGSLASKREDVQSLLESTKMMAATVTEVVRDNRTNLDRILDRLHNALLVLEANVKHLDMAFEYAGPSTRYFASIFIQGRWGDIYTCALILTATCEP